MAHEEGMEGRQVSAGVKRDLALVSRALEGDQSAYAELLGNYRENIYFMMFKMVRNQDDADDLTIEAFGKAFRQLHSFNPEFAFSTWLFRIASNNAIDFIRKKKKATTFSIDQDGDDEEGHVGFDIKSKDLNPEQELMKEQRIEEIRRIVSTLKPKYQRLVELRYLQEYSYEEIAEMLELPLGTVKAQLFRARDLMLQILKHNVKNI